MARISPHVQHVSKPSDVGQRVRLEETVRGDVVGSTRSSGYVLILVLCLVVVLCDAPARYSIGGRTLNAYFGAVVLIFLLACFFGAVWKGARLGLSMWGFVAWALVVSSTVSISIAGLQNLVVGCVGLLTGIVLFNARMSRNDLQFALDCINRAALVLVVVYGLVLLVGGLGAKGVITPRSFALEAVILMAILVPFNWTMHRYVFTVNALFLEICLSLSRTAMILAVVLVVLRASSSKRKLVAFRLAAFGLAGVSAVVYVANRIPLLRERFTGGDAAFRVGGISLNTEGRVNIWGALTSNLSSHLWTGHGAGSAELRVAYVVPGQTEPHNDYLRFLYDYGIIGLVLLAVWILLVLSRAATHLRGTEDAFARALHCSALLSLGCICITSLTDNSMTYLYVVVPVAMAVGLSEALNRGATEVS